MKIFKNKIKDHDKKSKSKKKSSIKREIQFNIITIVMVGMLLLGLTSSYLNYNTAIHTLETTLHETAISTSQVVKEQIDIYKTIAGDIGILTKISDKDISFAEKKVTLDNIKNKYDLYDIYIISDNGDAKSIRKNDGKNYPVKDLNYFKEAMAGKSTLVEPKFSNESGKYIIGVSAPLWENGISGEKGKVVGAILIEFDQKKLSDIISTIVVGDGGSCFIIDKEGTVLAHKEYYRVINKENIIKQAEEDKSNKEFNSLAKVEKKMLNNETNFGSYTMNGVSKFLSYAPIEETAGWGLLVDTPKSQYMNSTVMSIVITAIMVILAIIASIVMAKVMSKRIADPISYCAERLKGLAQGDLTTDVIITEREDEVGLLIKSLSSTVKGLNNVVKDITYHLGEIENSNFTTTVDLDYLGDFDAIEWSIRRIIKSLNVTMKQIDESAEQVANGSEQVAAGSQSLSQGATEQASSIEELAATVNEITEQINQTAKNAENAKHASLDAAKEVEYGSEQIKNMIVAIEDINTTSVQIGKIIKAIEDIAFQTNILALNAAVEAARAGTAGKGFAVVADEVRNLASKSAEAAKNTTELIENSLKAVSNGTKIAEKTDESLKLIVDKSNMALKLVEEIAAASEQQAIGASQITLGIEQISSVVQNNSATAEESAASSEELSSQAQVLKDIIKGIKLKDNLDEEVVYRES